MRITYFNNHKDVVVENYDDLSWPEIAALLSEHLISEVKDDLMFNLCIFDRLTDKSLPYDENRTDKRCTENVIGYDGLILDYDGNGAKMETIIQRFAEFRHCGYTSYRHILNEEGCEKFRIVFPFATTCPVAEWEARKENFLEFAGPEIDRSCVSHSRSFYTPACSEAGVEHKFAWNIDGEVLDWNWFVPVVKAVPVQKTHKPLAVSDLQRALDELQKHRSVLPNEDRYWLVRACCRHVDPSQAIIECRSRWPDAAYNGKYEDMVKKISPKGPTIGKIINEIRKYNPNYNQSKKAELSSILSKYRKVA